MVAGIAAYKSGIAFRTDIQALRGLAVLLVLLHHGETGPFRAGYLGVDVFFVISGFLITRMIKDGIEAERFSFAEFYFRRAKRLLPAAYVTFLFTALIAPFVLGSSELKDFVKQLTGSVTFTANWALLRQAGYFDGAAELKPLLHVWSLSLEEQYYLLLPALMVFTPRRFWLRGAIVVLAASLVWCFYLLLHRPPAAFFLLSARAWELAIGSIAALALLDGPRWRRFFRYSFWPAVAGLVLLPLSSIGPHPGLGALLICLATLCVMMRAHPWTNSSAISAGLAKVGDCSYSLYLTHWPILAFLNNAYLGDAPFAAHLLGLAAGVVAGLLLYRYIELPTRRAAWAPSKRFVSAGVAASAGLVLFSYTTIWFNASGNEYAQLRRSNYGFDRQCEFDEVFVARPECRNSPTPAVVVWGDSYAMHLVPGIAATTRLGVVQATSSLCGPFLDLAPLDDGRITTAWAQRCIDFNQSVLDYVAATPSTKVVVISSLYSQYLDESYSGRRWRLAHRSDGRLTEKPVAMRLAVEATARTVKALQALGKKVVVVAPPPASGVDMAECQERKATGTLLLVDVKDCVLPLPAVRAWQGRVREFLAQVKLQTGATVVDFDSVLCGLEHCATRLEEVLIYRDAGHLSYAGSRLLAEKAGLGRLIDALAEGAGSQAALKKP